MSGGGNEAERFLVWNGSLQSTKEISINPTSEGWLYGVGCFETMGLEDGVVRFFENHWHRLNSTASAMGLQIPFSPEQIEDKVSELAGKNQCTNGIARLSLHLNGENTDWMLRVFPSKRASRGSLQVGLSEMVHPGASLLSRWKNNNYLLHHLAFRQAQEAGWDEALMCRGDEVVEGTRSNVWILREAELLTPPLSSGALPGVIRHRLLALKSIGDLSVREERLRLEDLEEADGLFFSNAGMILRAATNLGAWEFPAHEDRVRSLATAIGADSLNSG